MFRRSFAVLAIAFAAAAALTSPDAVAADDASSVALLQAELRVTREQLTAANQQVASTIAAATVQIQALQKQLAEAKTPPAAAPPEKK